MEGAEDSETLPVEDLSSITPPLDPRLDTVIGIASSGRTPYVLAGLKYAKNLGCLSVGIACVSPSAMRGCCESLIECVTGSEVVTGSTRLKAGTATKMVRSFHIFIFVKRMLICIFVASEHDIHWCADQKWQDLWQSGMLCSFCGLCIELTNSSAR